MTAPAILAVHQANLDFARVEARARWGSASPYRVGFVVGQFSLTATNPYRPGSQAENSFEVGVERGCNQRERAR